MPLTAADLDSCSGHSVLCPCTQAAWMGRERTIQAPGKVKAALLGSSSQQALAAGMFWAALHDGAPALHEGAPGLAAA